VSSSSTTLPLRGPSPSTSTASLPPAAIAPEPRSPPYRFRRHANQQNPDPSGNWILFYPEASRREPYFQQRSREEIPFRSGIYESTRREGQKPPMREWTVRGCFADF
jgi:hypothetical protein